MNCVTNSLVSCLKLSTYLVMWMKVVVLFGFVLIMYIKHINTLFFVVAAIYYLNST